MSFVKAVLSDIFFLSVTALMCFVFDHLLCPARDVELVVKERRQFPHIVFGMEDFEGPYCLLGKRETILWIFAAIFKVWAAQLRWDSGCERNEKKKKMTMSLRSMALGILVARERVARAPRLLHKVPENGCATTLFWPCSMNSQSACSTLLPAKMMQNREKKSPEHCNTYCIIDVVLLATLLVEYLSK